jgi:hypothetical protein
MPTILPLGVPGIAVWAASSECKHNETQIAAGTEAVDGCAGYVEAEGGSVRPDPEDC